MKLIKDFFIIMINRLIKGFFVIMINRLLNRLLLLAFIIFIALFYPTVAAFVVVFYVIFIFGGTILYSVMKTDAIKREKLRIERKNIYRNKGLLVREFPNDYTIVDINTIGYLGIDMDEISEIAKFGIEKYLNKNEKYIPGIDEIFEIAAIKYRDNNIADTFSSLVKVDFIIPYDKEKLMGISNKMIKEAPTIDIVIKEFYDFVGSDILICYDSDFCIDFLYDNLFAMTKIELENNFIDIRRIAKRVLKSANEVLGEYSQEEVAKYYNIDNLHRALDGCKTCSMIYEKLKKDIIKRYGSLENFYRKKRRKQSV